MLPVPVVTFKSSTLLQAFPTTTAMPPRLRPPSSVAHADDISPSKEARRNTAMPFTLGPRGRSTNASSARSRMCATLCTPFFEDEDRIGVRRSGCMNTLCVRFAILVPFLVSVTFATAIFLYRAEIQNGLMPRGTVSGWSLTEDGTLFGSDDPLQTTEPAADEAEAYEGTYDGTAIPSEAGADDAVGSEPSTENAPATMPEAEPEAPAAAEPVQTPNAARRTASVPVPRRGLVSKSGRGSDSNDLWGDPSSESEPAFFEINDTVSSFVGNMGLVFGLIYAFVFGRSYSRFDSMMSTFYGEVAAMHKLVLLVQTVQLPEEAVQNMIEFLKNYADQCRYEVVSGIMLSDSDDTEVMTQLYAIVPALRLVIQNQGDRQSMATAELNSAIMEVMLSTIGDLCNLRYERWNLAQKAIPFILWVLIVMSAMLMFFGVLLMQSGWYNVDFWMCLLTVASIGLLIYCLADLDQTHTGFMRIPVNRLDRLQFVGRAALTTGNTSEPAINAFSGIWAAVSLVNGINGGKKSSPLLHRVASRRSSAPVFPERVRSAVMEGKGRTSSLQIGSTATGTRRHSDNCPSRDGLAAASISARQASSMEGWMDDPGTVASSTEERSLSDGIGSATLPKSPLADELRPHQVQLATTDNGPSSMKRNSILLARDAFGSFSPSFQKEVNVADIDINRLIPHRVGSSSGNDGGSATIQ